MERQYIVVGDGSVEPVRQHDLDVDHPTVGVEAPDRLPTVDQAKIFLLLDAASFDVRLDAHAAQAVESLPHEVVATGAGATVGRNQEVVGGQMDDFVRFPVLPHALDKLRAAVDEDVLVPDRRHPVERIWSDCDHAPVVLVVPGVPVRRFTQGEERVLHARLVVLERPERKVGDK